LASVRSTSQHSEQSWSLTVNEPGRVFFLEHQMVGGGVAADAMQEHLGGAEVLVHPRVEKAARIAHPDDGPVGILDDIGAIFAGRQVAPGNIVQFVAVVVAAPGEKAMVGRVQGLVEAEESLALGLPVAVEQNLLGAALGRAAADQLMLAVLAITAVV
jgi:hypothetical protein